MDKTKLQKVKALMLLGNTFKQACLCLGYDPEDPDLIENDNIPQSFKDMFGL